MGRELALQWLFQIDVGHLPPEEVMATVPEEILDEEDEGTAQRVALEEEGVGFAQKLVHGVINDRQRIDEIIEKYAKGWPIDRMAAIERNVLRIALCEILNMADIPASVSIDEAVEIAKHFGTDDSGKFVNGILGAFMRAERSEPERA